jgi:hypothetical protein
MSKYLPVTLGIAAMLIASTSLAQARGELEKSTIKAATDCVATAALKDPNITTLYREDRLDEVTDRIVLYSSVCDSPLRAMRLLHDRLYGEGTGRTFLRGAYLADLPRAVGERIKVVFNSQGKAPLPPSANGPLNAGEKLKVEGVGPNDVLNMREYATTNSPIIDVIAPNTEGIIYLGETVGGVRDLRSAPCNLPMFARAMQRHTPVLMIQRH